MKHYIDLGKWTLALSLGLSFFSMQALAQEHEHAKVLNPEEEARYYEEAYQKEGFGLLDFKFAQTDWRECTHDITGNYTGYRCANRRGISVISTAFYG